MKKLLYMFLGVLTVVSAYSEENNGFRSPEELRFYQTMLRNACKNVGVNPSKCQNIRAEYLENPCTIMQADLETNEVIVNMHYVDGQERSPLTYGQINAVLHHEAVHLWQGIPGVVKLTTVLEASLFLGVASVVYTFSTLLSPTLDEGVKNLGKAFICGSGSATLVLQYTSEHRETQADTKGCLAVKCSTCVEEKARFRYLQTNSEGYLGAFELWKIAQQHRENNLLCEGHRYLKLGQKGGHLLPHVDTRVFTDTKSFLNSGRSVLASQ